MAPARRSKRAKPATPEPEPEPQVDSDAESELSDAQEGEEEQSEAEAGPQEEGADEAGEEELVKLQFDEELTWRPGRPIAVGTLLPRLERLFEEMSEMDQDTVDKESLGEIAQALVNRNLIQHKDWAVKATVAECLVEILRLCAPDAPYTEDQLKVGSAEITEEACPLTNVTDALHLPRQQHSATTQGPQQRVSWPP
jgi:sister-chromatid-cohesion protein PDS5